MPDEDIVYIQRATRQDVRQGKRSDIAGHYSAYGLHVYLATGFDPLPELGAGLEGGDGVGFDDNCSFFRNESRLLFGPLLGTKATKGAQVDGFPLCDAGFDHLEESRDNRFTDLAIHAGLLTDPVDELLFRHESVTRLAVTWCPWAGKKQWIRVPKTAHAVAFLGSKTG